MDLNGQDDLVEKVRKISRLVYPTHNFEGHILPVVDLALKFRKHFPDSDERVVECAAYLHDIGRVTLGCPYHEHTGAAITRYLLPLLGFDAESTERITYCVRSHGSRQRRRDTPEATIIANADGYSHFERFMYVFAIHYSHHRDFSRTRDWLVRKLRSDLDSKITIPEVKEAAENLLEEIKICVGVSK